ncbi:protein CASC3 [Tetranychus urticae]|uniref:protein CASC3 n=1 Tax=Tetranychus urticae TaxID=32264 RepID=UPI00077BE14B|nr:protein CASC3 [Tetranychus urticae]
MSDTKVMEKEFTEDELAGGESLVDDEDLSDEEYVEALGEHDEGGKKNHESPKHGSHQHKEKVSKDKDSRAEKEKPKGECEDIDSVKIESEDNDKDELHSVETSKVSTEPVDKIAVTIEESDENTDNLLEDGEDDDEDDDGEVENDEEEDEEDDGSIEGEREEGDGQESNEISKQTDKELDDDEDRRNPQYIPKRGAFYEHDDRLGTDEEVDEEEEPEKPEAVEKKTEPVVEVRKPKKLWSDDGKWGHDMFDDDEQKPKPRDEIVSTYGYDIRNEDGPPKARRRRRYGRGPNRYTRSWKDEGAYSSPKDVISKVKPKVDDNVKRDKEPRPVTLKESEEKRPSSNRRSGSGGRSRNEPKSVFKANDRDRDRDQSRGKEGKDIGLGRERNRERERDRDRRRYDHNRSPGPSKDLRDSVLKTDKDLKRNQKDFSENDFPELPQKTREKIRPIQQVTTGDANQPNAWSKSRPKHSNARDIIREGEGSEEFKSEPMKVVENFENSKRLFNLPDSNKIEIVKTQTFENSRYFNRRHLTKNHHQEPTNVKKDLALHRNNRGRPRQGERDVRNSGEIGRPITKTSHLADDYEEDPSGSGTIDQHRRGRYNIGKERELRDYRSNHHGLEDRDRRGSEEPRGRSYIDDRHFDGHFGDNQGEISVGMSKLSIDKSRLADDSNLSKPKRYSSLRQHQTQQQHQHQLQQSEPHPAKHQQQQHAHKQPQSQPPQQSIDNQPNSNLNQYPATSQHITMGHSRQTTNVQYYEATSGANQQPSASYYIDNRSPQSSFGYIPTTNIEGATNATRFLSQIAPRFIPPPPAPPPPPPEPRFMAQAVAAAAAANPATAGAGTLPPVISGPPAATYLPTYPPGYPQYPPPPPAAAQFSIAPPPPPSASELYRGGVTYYDTMTQQVSPRQLPQRRPKNALPIVPPPDLSNSDATGYDDQSDLNQNVETVSC